MAEAALGYLLRSLREEKGLSLRETAQKAGIDHAYIHRLETGVKESPSEETLNKLIRALKPSKREAEMLRYLAEHSNTNAELVAAVRDDPSVSNQVFAAAAGAAFRGAARPDCKKLIERVRKILDEENGA